MLAKISYLTAFGFSVLYPLSFWLHAKKPLQNNFHRFHLGCPTVIGAVTCFFIAQSNYSVLVQIYSILWVTMIFLTTLYYWNRKSPDLYSITLSSILGISVFICMGYESASHDHLPLVMVAVPLVLGALIFSFSFFAMNLGHWYLNVHGLPIEYLKNANRSLLVVIVARMMWDILLLANYHLILDGDTISLWLFFFKPDGYLLFLGIFFGLLFPILSLILAEGTLKLKNTQATTGILYVALCAVVLADIVYKFYFIKYGISL